MTDHTASAETRRDWFSTMVRIRHFEDKVQELFMSGAIGGTTHLCQGQEAVSVGSIAAMRPGDVQTNTYRGHGEALALGMTPETAFAELMGKTTGGSGGVGGSMHLIDFSKGNIGANAIVGAGLPIAVGAAVGFQMQKRPNVALSFFGDGATNIGTFHEALNMAAVWKAPVVFIITNNLYGEYIAAPDHDQRRSRPRSTSGRATGCRASSSTARTSMSSTARSATQSSGPAAARARPCSR